MKNPSRTYPGGIQTVIRFLIDFVILTVIGFACGTGKAYVGASYGAARRPNGLAANYAFGAVILGVQRSLECFNQFFTVVAFVTFHDHVGKLFNRDWNSCSGVCLMVS